MLKLKKLGIFHSDGNGLTLLIQISTASANAIPKCKNALLSFLFPEMLKLKKLGIFGNKKSQYLRYWDYA